MATETNSGSTDLSLERKKEFLLTAMWKTKGARFAASERMLRLESRHNFLTTYATITIIAFSIFLLVVPVNKLLSDVVSAMSVIASVTVLTVSLRQSAEAYAVKADKFHRCGTEINSVWRRLWIETTTSEVELQRYFKEYDDIIKSYNLNHSTADYNEFMSRYQPSGSQAVSAVTSKISRWIEGVVRSSPNIKVGQDEHGNMLSLIKSHETTNQSIWITIVTMVFLLILTTTFAVAVAALRENSGFEFYWSTKPAAPQSLGTK